MKSSKTKFIWLLAIIKLSTTGLQAQISFESPDIYNIGDTPYALKAGDFNNDGFMDMVSGNFSNTVNKRISVIMNNPSGFPSAFTVTNLSALESVIDVDTADFNNDGNLDFVAAVSSGDSISIYLGNGDGTFSQNDIASGDDPQGIVTGDFNNDSNPDIAVINRFSNDLYIYLGDGSGGMGNPLIITETLLDNSLTLGDFNNDNNLDILASSSNFFSGSVEFYAGDGTGNFAAKVSSPGIQNGGFFFMHGIDINKDGNMDLVANTSTRPFVSLGAGDGTFAAPILLGKGGRISVVVDFDKDGNLDVFSQGSYYPGVGDGTFLQRRIIPNVGGFGLTTADLDNDGNLDFATASGGVIPQVKVVYGKGNGHFYAPTQYPVPNNPRGLTMGDFNGDGLEDLALCAYGTLNNNLYIYLGQADGTFINSGILDAGIWPTHIEALDINADGEIDLAVLDVHLSTQRVNLFTGDGTGGFTPAGNLAVTATSSFSVDDVNKDNITDLILAGGTDNNVQIFEGNGDATFSLLIDLDVGESVRDVLVANINDVEDTNPDLALLVQTDVGRQIRFYQGDGLGGFIPAGTNLDLTNSGNTFTKEDFNNDGHIDFLTLATDGDIFVGDGAFSFSQSSTNTGVSLSEHSTEVKDIDGDGIKDLISGSQGNLFGSGGPLWINRGIGDGTFSSAFWSQNGVGGYRIIVSDFNNDGKNDIASLVNNSTFDGLSILLNNTPCSSGSPAPDVADLADLTGECSVTMPTAPTATSSCTGSITGTANVTFPITNTTIVTWTYDDGDGNTSTQNQNIIITDGSAPVADMASLADLTDACSVSIPAAPTATDNCAGSLPGAADATFPITATTTVTWTYDDGNGNASTQTQDVIITPIDNTVSQSGSALTANADSFTYQWIDCNNGNDPISGETNQNFVATTSGSYAVEINNGSCTVTSGCISITILGESNLADESGILIYPNPVSNVIYIDLDGIQEATIKLLSLDGRLMNDFGARGGKNIEVRMDNLQPGVYILEVTKGESIHQQKIIVR